MRQYDLHIHTNISRCAGLTPQQALSTAKKRGLDGIAITDHDAIEGARRVQKINTDPEFEVIVGCEIKTTDAGEVLAYYLTEEVTPGPLHQVLSQLRKQGAIAALAHPFDPFRHHFRQVPAVDAIETCNGRTLLMHHNRKARETARMHGLAGIAGSDAHFPFEIGRCITRFEGELRTAIQNRQTSCNGSQWHAPIAHIRTAIRKTWLGLLHPRH